MTIPESELALGDSPLTDSSVDEEKNERRRRFLLLLLLLLLVLCCCLGYFILRYLAKPAPLPEMVPGLSEVINTPPNYRFYIPLNKPVAVVASRDGERIYGAESDNERLIKLFNRDGDLVTSFAPPFTNKHNRSWNYMGLDANERLFAVDTYNDVLVIFDKDGNFIDGLISRDTTLSEYITQQTGEGLPPGTLFYLNGAARTVDYQFPGEELKSLPAPERNDWSPLGVRFDPAGNLLLTNTAAGFHQVLVYPAEALSGSLTSFDPQVKAFGAQGTDNNQFSFPNAVMVDNLGNYYISDSNNGRISLWTPEMTYKTFFGFGSSENALNLPHGIWIDSRNRLHVADTVGQSIRVYRVAGDEQTPLFSFGIFGIAEGEFNFPNDICIDETGRLYIADRENNRIQVWSY